MRILLGILLVVVTILAAQSYALRKFRANPKRIYVHSSEKCRKGSREIINIRWTTVCQQRGQKDDCTLPPDEAKGLAAESSLYVFSCMQDELNEEISQSLGVSF